MEVLDVLVEHHERSVVKARLDDGELVAVKRDVDSARIGREVAALRAAAAAGIPVPAIRDHQTGPLSVLVLEWIDGAWLAPDRSDRAWRNVGAYLRRIHELDVPGLGPVGRHDWTTRIGIEAEVAQQLDHLQAEGPPATATLHGDAQAVHVRLDDDDEVLAMLDFGDAARGDPALDLAVVTLWTPEKLPAVLAGYGADDTLADWVARAVPVYRAVRFLDEATWLADHGYDPADAAAAAVTAAAALL